MLETILQYIVEYGLMALLSIGLFLFNKFKTKQIAKNNEDQIEYSIGKATEDAVGATYQTFVQPIKGTSAWDDKAQQEALKMSIKSAKDMLSVDVLDFIEEKYGKINSYLTDKIESTLYKLKNKNKNKEE